MTNRQTAAWLMTMLAVVATLAVVGTAKGENYGCVSRSQCAKMEALIRAWFPASSEGTMVCIARRESGLNPRAANWSDSHGGSFGLFQLNGVHDPSTSYYASKPWIQRMFDPVQNVRLAYRLSRAGTRLGPWGGGC